MSEKPNDGGPAFPFAATDASNVPMRDYFAGQFIAGAAVGNDPLNRAEGESIDVARA